LVATALAVIGGGPTRVSAAPTSVTAAIVNSTLQVSGTDGADQVALRLRATDPTVLEVDAGNDGTADFLFPRSAVTSIVVDLAGGSDLARIDQSGGVFTDTTPTTLNGGDGNDTLVGGSGSEKLIGGGGADFVDGNFGADIVSLGLGNDTFQWDPGDGSDVVNGGAGIDQVLFNGANANETIDLSATGGRLRFARDIASINLDIGTVEQINLAVRGGADKVTVHDLTGTGVTGVNVDLANSDPSVGDGAVDQVITEGTPAVDTVAVTGAYGVGSVSGLPVPVTVSHAEPTIDILSINTLSDNDHVTADPAVGGAIRAQIDTGDGVDSVVTNGSAGSDAYNVLPDGAFVAVINGNNQAYEMAAESLTINALAGDDTVNASNGLATHTALALFGGDGNDTLRGGDGNDVIDGGAGADFVDGNPGQDLVSLGDGDDVFQWDPGDNSDVVNGDTGTDRVLFNGANIGEIFDLSANGNRLRLQRDIASVTLDAGGIEQVDLLTKAGADRVTVHDLAGTGVAKVNADLAGTVPTQGDGESDQVIAEGTNNVDTINVAALAGIARVGGLAASVRVLHADLAFDRLDVNTLDGEDIVTSSLLRGVIQLFVDGNPV
jgi:Ca2+-binding RTX toxin-like protein